MRFKIRYHVHTKIKNRVHEHGGCDSKYDITYSLNTKKKELLKHRGCISKYDIIHFLRKKESGFVSIEDLEIYSQLT